MSKSTINQRMQIIVDKKFSGNKAAFAEAIGMAPNSISNYLGKKRLSTPSADLLEKIVNSLGINAYWLITGVGRMDTPNAIDVPNISQTPRFRTMVEVDLTLEEIEEMGLMERFKSSIKTLASTANSTAALLTNLKP